MVSNRPDPRVVVDLPQMLKSNEVAELLGVTPSTLSRWRSVGVGPRVYWLTATCRGTGRTTSATGSNGSRRDRPQDTWRALAWGRQDRAPTGSKPHVRHPAAGCRLGGA